MNWLALFLLFGARKRRLLIRALLPNPHPERLVWARADAVAAADAFAAVGSGRRVDVHLARFGAGVASDALGSIKMHAVQGDLIEKAIDGAERADIFAEGPVDDEARDEDQAEDNELQIK